MQDKVVRVRPSREGVSVHGGKVIVIGDLHVSSTFVGQHRNYLTDCYLAMERVLEIVQSSKASAVVFLGDLAGVSEKNIRDRQVLARYMGFFKRLNDMTKGNVYSVKGNHDFGDFTDFDMLLTLGYIKNPAYIDYYGQGGGLEVRFHLVNYGDERLRLAMETTGASNVILGHNDFYIQGVTNWYSAGGDLRLAELNNFIGAALVVSGHIHIPSSEVLFTTLPDSSSVGLFYVGCPTRVSDRYEDCWYFVFDCRQDEDGIWSTSYDAVPFGLGPVEEFFFPEEDFVDSQEDVELAERVGQSAALTAIVRDIMEGRITSGDLYRQIDIVPGASDEAKELAKKYLEIAGKEDK